MLTDFFETFKYQTHTETDSTLGGKVDTWADGSTFQAGISLNNSREAQIAYHNGLATQYTIVMPTSVTLRQDDRVKRATDGVVFRITSDSPNMKTPACAALQYAQVTAEVIV